MLCFKDKKDIYNTWSYEISLFYNTYINIFLAVYQSGSWSCALKMLWSGIDLRKLHFSEGAILKYFSLGLSTISSLLKMSFDANLITLFWKWIDIRCFKILLIWKRRPHIYWFMMLRCLQYLQPHSCHENYQSMCQRLLIKILVVTDLS